MPVNQKPHIHEFIVCANIFVKKNGTYLMLKRSPLKKYAPNVVHPIGGKVDADENPYQAANREVFEEAGVKMNNLKLEACILEIAPHKNEPHNWLIFHFSGDWASGKIKTTEEGEFIWLKPSKISKHLLFPSVREAIKHIINPHDGTVFMTCHYNKEKTNIIKRVKNLCVV